MKKVYFLSILIIASMFLVGFLCFKKDSTPILDDKEVNNKVMHSAISMMLETEANSGVYEEAKESAWPQDGYVFNTTRSKCENGSELSWDGTKVIMKGNVSDKCYVYFDKVQPYPKYWNDDFSYSTDYINPDTPILTYPSVSALQTGYGIDKFRTNPLYIKTTETEHQVCLYLEERGKEFCLEPYYFINDAQDMVDGSSTKAKLKAAMEEALGIPTSSCSSDNIEAYCSVADFTCTVHTNGHVNCKSNGGCYIDVDMGASCRRW